MANHESARTTGLYDRRDDQVSMGESPGLLTTPAIHPYVLLIVERFRPSTAVLSQDEIHPKAKINTLEQI